MLSTIADAAWSAPVIYYHALAPEIVLGGGIVLLLLLDLFIADAKKRKLRVVPADAATVQKAVNDAIANANPEMVSRASKMIYGK